MNANVLGQSVNGREVPPISTQMAKKMAKIQKKLSPRAEGEVRRKSGLGYILCDEDAQ